MYFNSLVHFPIFTSLHSARPGTVSATSATTTATNFGLITNQSGGAATAEADVTSRSYVCVPRPIKLFCTILKCWVRARSIVVLDPFEVRNKVASRTDAVIISK